MWQPLVKCTEPSYFTEEHVREVMRLRKCTEEEARAALNHPDDVGAEYWVNDTYQAMLVVKEQENGDKTFQINIRRIDGEAIFRDWREFQAIKNQLVGDEVEAVELYPAESRKMDSSNKYHLWGVLDPTWRFPLGMSNRAVSYRSSTVLGMKQRPYSGTPDGEVTD